MTTIYIAGSSAKAERERIQTFIQAVTDYGYRVTHDWTTHFGLDMPPPGPSHEVLFQAARDDLAGVVAADEDIMPRAELRLHGQRNPQEVVHVCF